MSLKIINKVKERLKSILIPPKIYNFQIEYWEQRYNKYGGKSVIQLGQSIGEYGSITKHQ